VIFVTRPRLLRDLILILVLASLWAISGYVIGLAIEVALIPYAPLKVIFASLNLIIGMLLFKGVVHDTTAERIFFEGPKPDEEGLPAVGCLWIMPVSLIFVGVLMLFWAIILRFILK